LWPKIGFPPTVLILTVIHCTYVPSPVPRTDHQRWSPIFNCRDWERGYYVPVVIFNTCFI